MGEQLLVPFELYGWKPNNALSDDANFMDLVLLVTRSSQLQQGGMACILVRQKKDSETCLTNRIIAVANNQELYKPRSSDIHAEIAAIGQAAKSGRATGKCTAYITMPPCKTCLGALLAADIGRVVSLYPPPVYYQPLMQKRKFEMIGVDDKEERRLRIDAIVSTHTKNTEVETMSIGSTSREGIA
jgi:tRNA(Arg) A34 adenosine deaminase TadA